MIKTLRQALLLTTPLKIIVSSNNWTIGWAWFACAAQEFSAQRRGASCDITKLISTHINLAPIMSINQLSCYHVAMKMYNIINHSSSDLPQKEFKVEQSRYNLRCLEDGPANVPEKMKKSCTLFSYIGSKLWYHLSDHIRMTTIKSIFKGKLKDWIWKFIPSVRQRIALCNRVFWAVEVGLCLKG